MDWTNAFESNTKEEQLRQVIDAKIGTIVDYYMHNMLDEPETIRDALQYYLESAGNSDINAIYKDLFGNLDRR